MIYLFSYLEQQRFHWACIRRSKDQQLRWFNTKQRKRNITLPKQRYGCV